MVRCSNSKKRTVSTNVMNHFMNSTTRREPPRQQSLWNTPIVIYIIQQRHSRYIQCLSHDACHAAKRAEGVLKEQGTVDEEVQV